MQLAIFGAGGYTGGHLTEEALRRGHTVVAVSRSAGAPGPAARAGVTARPGSVTDTELVAGLAAEVDALVLAVPALLESTSLADLVPGLLEVAERHGVRLGIVGGAGSLQVTPGGPALYDAVPMPAHVLAGSKAQGDVLAALQASDSTADWFYLSPAGRYGRHSPGERTGTYRVGGEVLLTGADGESRISGADYAIAFLDELEQPTHARQRFSVAY